MEQRLFSFDQELISSRFFAQSWNNPQQLSEADADVLLSEVQSNFEKMAQSLPQRFESNLERVRQELPSLFSGAFPFVLTHGDLNEINTLVDTDSGNITGIVDWAEARILPFGFALYGTEYFFGYMSPDGWHYRDDHRELERLFWQTFQESVKGFSDDDLRLIRAARMAGMFYRHALVLDPKHGLKPSHSCCIQSHVLCFVSIRDLLTCPPVLGLMPVLLLSFQ